MLPQRIVAIGSSSLFGLVDPQGGGYIGRLKTWHENQNINNKVYNLGISGDTTTGMLKRFPPEVSIRKPNLILITSGLNDTRKIGGKSKPPTTPVEQFKKNIETLIKKGKTLTDVVFISVFPIDDKKTSPLLYWNHDDYFYCMTDAIKYAKIVNSICETERVPYLDIFNEWLHQDYKQWLFEDGLHANAVGHEKIYKSLKSFLLNLYS